MTINNPIHQDVSCFSHLGSETVKQTSKYCNNPRNTTETYSLKALADKVLARNKLVNKTETTAQKSVSCPEISETENCQFEMAEIIKSQFQEHAAIYEFEANYSREEAELWARKDVLAEFITNQYPQIMVEFESIITQHLIN